LNLFRWLSATPIPAGIDLRRCGWQLVNRDQGRDVDYPIAALASAESFADAQWSDLGEWRFQPLRRLVLLIGIPDADLRVKLLSTGFGDVMPRQTSLAEIEARALRVVANAEALPRIRQIGTLRLDLFARDGFVSGTQLGLHPREFALAWRLADTPGKAVAKKVLVRDVWRMAFIPDTNSLAVHVFRLRSKLELAGLPGLIKTDPSGGYLLLAPSAAAKARPFMLADSDGQEEAAMALSAEQYLPWEQ
jgi:two-component system, OmpR family, response regulator